MDRYDFSDVHFPMVRRCLLLHYSGFSLKCPRTGDYPLIMYLTITSKAKQINAHMQTTLVLVVMTDPRASNRSKEFHK